MKKTIYLMFLVLLGCNTIDETQFEEDSLQLNLNNLNHKSVVYNKNNSNLKASTSPINVVEADLISDEEELEVISDLIEDDNNTEEQNGDEYKMFGSFSEHTVKMSNSINSLNDKLNYTYNGQTISEPLIPEAKEMLAFMKKANKDITYKLRDEMYKAPLNTLNFDTFKPLSFGSKSNQEKINYFKSKGFTVEQVSSGKIKIVSNLPSLPFVHPAKSSIKFKAIFNLSNDEIEKIEVYDNDVSFPINRTV